MAIKYPYLIDDFPYDKADASRLTVEIQSSAIVIALDHICVNNIYCDIWFKAELSQGYQTTLSDLVSAHSGELIPEESAPTMDDGRPIVRSDTRPLGTQTYFTCAGDSENDIGDGESMMWDFSNDDNTYDPDDLENPPTVASGFKAKRMDMCFIDPIYLKDGSVYFQNASFGTYASMYITVPAGNFYPNASGTYTSAMLGLSGSKMYALASKDVIYASYINRHYMLADCVMGDELNAEGTQVTPIPPGWYTTGIVVTTDDNDTFRGFGSFEVSRKNTTILPGGALNGDNTD